MLVGSMDFFAEIPWCGTLDRRVENRCVNFDEQPERISARLGQCACMERFLDCKMRYLMKVCRAQPSGAQSVNRGNDVKNGGNEFETGFFP